MMNVLLIADSPMEEPVSGLEQVLHHQARELLRAGNRVYALTRKDDARAEPEVKHIDGVTIGSYNAPTGNLIGFCLSLLINPLRLFNRFQNESRFDVVIVHQALTLLPLLLWGKFNNIPIMYVLHSPWHEEYLIANSGQQNVRVRVSAVVRRLIEKFCVSRAIQCITLSRYMLEKLHAVHRIDKQKISVCPGGADMARFESPFDRQLLKGNLGLPERTMHLLTVRNLEARMGLENLLRCIEILVIDRKISLHLSIGGEGPERPSLERSIIRRNLNKAVTLTGFIPADRLPLYYQAADFFVLPTLELEGFGLVTIESMACGTPVLGTPVGGTLEILSGFKSEFLFDDSSPEAMADGVQSAMEKYIVGGREYERLRQRCRSHVEKRYSWKSHSEHLISIIENALKT